MSFEKILYPPCVNDAHIFKQDKTVRPKKITVQIIKPGEESTVERGQNFTMMRTCLMCVNCETIQYHIQ